MTKVIGASNNGLDLIWNLSRKCNYNCSYCSTEKNGVIFLDADYIDEINQHKDNIDLLILSGGEPTLSPILKEILYKSNIPVKLWTNLSKPVEYYLDLVSIKKFKIHTSFHPGYTDFTSYIKKIEILSKHVDILCNVMISNDNTINLAKSSIERIAEYATILNGRVLGIRDYYKEKIHIYNKELLCTIDSKPYYDTNRQDLNLKSILVKCDMHKHRIVLDVDKKFKCCHLTSSSLYDMIFRDYILCSNQICSPMYLRRGKKDGIFKKLHLEYEL